MRSTLRPALSLATLLAITTLLPGQDRWRVRCTAPDGAPVEGAEVWVFQNEPRPDGSSHYPTAGPFTTGADGWAATVAERTYDGGRFYRWAFARVAGKFVGTVTCSRPEAQPRIELQPIQPMRGRVTVPAGHDPTQVLVRVASLADTKDGRLTRWYPRASNFPGLEYSLPAIFDCRPTADGTFELNDLPRGARLNLITEAPGLAHGDWGNAPRFDGSVPDLVFRLQPESVLSGQVLGPRRAPVANAEVAVCFVDDRATYRHEFRTTTDEAGKYRVPGLPSGVLRIAVTTPAGLARPCRFLMKASQQLDDVDLLLERGVELRGLVVDGDGTPIEHAAVVAATQRNDGDPLGSARTDAQGRFSMRVASGAAHLYLAYVPGGWDRERTESSRDLLVEGDDADLQQLQFEVVRR